MEYVEEVLDRQTGTLKTVSQGEWNTITEIGEFHGVGPRKARSILRQMGVLQIETRGRVSRHRLCRWMVDQAWGRRIEKKGTVPFDVIGPEGQRWIAEKWAESLEKLEETSLSAHVRKASVALERFKAHRSGPFGTQMAVSWLADHFPDLSQSEVAALLDVSQQLVSRFQTVRYQQHRKWYALRVQPLAEGLRRSMSYELDMWGIPDGYRSGPSC